MQPATDNNIQLVPALFKYEASSVTQLETQCLYVLFRDIYPELQVSAHVT